MMLNPGLYSKYNGVVYRDVGELLNEYSTKIKWKEEGEKVIDVGCGDGSVTVNVLKKYLPSNYVRLVGLDISEEAIEYANDKYGESDSRLQFVLHDIQKDLPVELKGSFDKVFSFYAFHFISDHAAAFKNMYQLLSGGGICLLNFIGRGGLFEIYSTMSRTAKWKTWLMNLEQVISPYQFSQQPAAELEAAIKKSGFNQVKVRTQRTKFVYESVQYVKQIVAALNTFNLPGALLDDFVSDFMRIGLESGVLRMAEGDKGDLVTYTYDLVTAYAAK